MLLLLFSSRLIADGDARPELPKGPGKQVAVFVALCDNENQGIAPVPESIGRGDDPKRNLYWGCSEALPPVLRASREWGRPTHVASFRGQAREVLEAMVCSRADKRATIYAFAYRGDSMEACMEAFESALVCDLYDLVVFIGHNGLMDMEMADPEPASSSRRADAIVLCCMSREYFEPRLQALRCRPVLLTEQYMYPAGPLLPAALNAWLQNPADREAIRTAAAKAYAANQKISLKAAKGVFASL